MALLALGFVGAGISGVCIGTYAIKFFSPTADSGLPLLMPIGAVGVIQSIGFLFDRLIDPFIAQWSDQSRNPKGKRTPFMKWAFIPAGLLSFFVFLVPARQQSWLNVLWVAFFMLAHYFTRSLYDINLAALIPEIIRDADQRVKYYAIRTTLAIVGQALILLVPAVVEILMKGGMGAVSAWQVSIIPFSIVGILLMMIPLLGIKETEYAQSQVREIQKTSIWESIRTVFRMKAFMTYISADVCFALGGGLFGQALIFILELMFGFSGTMFSAANIISLFLAFAFFPVVMSLSKKRGKKLVLITGIISAFVSIVIALFCRQLAPLFGSATAEGGVIASLAGEGASVSMFWIAIAIALILAYYTAVMNIIGVSIVGDFVQYYTMTTGESRSAMLAAVYNVIQSLPATVIPAIVGAGIYFRAADQLPTIDGCYFLIVLSLVFVLLSFFLYMRYDEKSIFAVIKPKAEPDSTAWMEDEPTL